MKENESENQENPALSIEGLLSFPVEAPEPMELAKLAARLAKGNSPHELQDALKAAIMLYGMAAGLCDGKVSEIVRTSNLCAFSEGLKRITGQTRRDRAQALFMKFLEENLPPGKPGPHARKKALAAEISRLEKNGFSECQIESFRSLFFAWAKKNKKIRLRPKI